MDTRFGRIEHGYINLHNLFDVLTASALVRLRCEREFNLPIEELLLSDGRNTKYETGGLFIHREYGDFSGPKLIIGLMRSPGREHNDLRCITVMLGARWDVLLLNKVNGMMFV